MASLGRKFTALALFALGVGFALAQPSVPAYNTYLAAPFVIDGKGGLAADLVAYLNRKLIGKAVFELQVLPRERFNQTVIKDANFKGVVLFLNPGFVGDLDQTKFAWTAAFMADGNEIVSPTSQRVEYDGPDSLKGLALVGVRGHKYAGLEERFGKDIKRADLDNELQVLKMLASERADVAVMASSMYRYLLQTYGVSDGLIGKLHLSATQHLKFDRFMFTAAGNTVLHQQLAAVATHMPKDPTWIAILAKYDLK